VVNGRELQMKKQVARRSAVGVTMKNRVILLNTDDTEVYAQDLARIFHLPNPRRVGMPRLPGPGWRAFGADVRGV